MQKWKQKLLTHPLIHLFYNLKLKQKLLISYIVLIILPLTIFYSFTFNKISGIISSNTNYSALQNFDQTFSFLSYKMYQIYKAADVIFSDKPVNDILAKDSSDYSIADQLTDMATLTIYLTSFQDSVDIDRARLYVSKGLYYSDEGVNIFSLGQASRTAWYKRMVDKKVNLLFFPSNYFGEEENAEEMLSAARFIINSSNYADKPGIIRLDFKKSNIEEVIRKANTLKGSLTYLQNSLGEIVAASDAALIRKYSMDSRTGLKMYDMNKFEEVLIGSEKVLFRTRSIPLTDWRMITVIPENEITEQIEQSRVQILILMLIISTVAYVLAFSIAHFTVKRIQILKDQMNKVQMGNMDSLVNNGSNDEIGELINDYNFMVKKIDVLMKQQYQSGQKLKTAELKALQAQINPHFLYNTLEMINRLSKKNKVSEIDSTLQALAKFYKLSLNRGEDMITLKDELDHVSAYAAIQSIRFMQKIEFEIDIPQDLHSCLVPKIILQPIVENAILHGILEKTSRSGNIRIYCDYSDESTTLYIEDNGIGIPEDMLVKINAGQVSSSRGSSYGIKNVIERIKLLYGDQYGLEYTSEYGTGTTVIISLPGRHSLVSLE